MVGFPQAPGGRLLPGMVRGEAQPQGLDLSSMAGKRWLNAVVRVNRPELLVAGPLYKLSSGDPKDEQAARALADYFDRLRKRHHLSMILEAHSPHGDLGDRSNWRPYGASLWMRWPEFGFGLAKTKKESDPAGKPITELLPWRFARDRNRKWPRRLKEGPSWPWMVDE
jgi:hypothetical protein